MSLAIMFRSLMIALALGAGLVSAAAAATPPDQFPLGESAQSGAVCQAVRNDDDPAGDARGALAWEVRCRGWDGALGRLYLYDYHGDAQIKPTGLWGQALAARASCEADTAATVEGLARVRRAQCRAVGGKVPYVAFSGDGRHGRAVAAEGFVQIADVLQTGLRVVGGVARPPKVMQQAQDAASAAAESQPIGLAEATATASSAPENLRERGFIHNTAWRFTDAETDFRALALDPSVPSTLRAEAFLNWALNTSNLGQFSRADTLFAQAAKLADTSELRGLTLSYEALHLRNQRHFREAIVAAKKAQDLLSSLAPDAGGGGAAMETAPDGALVIGPQLAAALRPAGDFSTTGVDPSVRIQLRIAQTELAQASCYQALGQPDQARAALEQARARLAQPSVARVQTFLRAQVNAELARQYEAQGHGPEARLLLAQSLDDLRKQQPGSPVEAYMTMELARAEADSGATDLALTDFRAAVDLFRETRGSLSASADSVSTYLDLLMKRAKGDRAGLYAADYLVALESVASQGTADTVARLTARLNEKDTAAAGLIRALEDTRRQVRAKESGIALADSQPSYPGSQRAADQAELKTLTDEATQLEARVAAADPRYGQLVSSDVTLFDLQRALKPGEVYVKVSLLGLGGYGIAVTHDDVTPYRIALTQAQGMAAVAKLRRPFEAQNYLPAYDVASAYKLFQALFDPVRSPVLAARHVIYEPDNTLLSLPIAALVTDQASVDLVMHRRQVIRAQGQGILSYDGVAWLGRKASTSLVVSVAAFVQARQAPASAAARPMIGFGDSIQASADDPRAFSAVTKFAGVGDADVDVCRATRDALLSLKPLKEATRELESVSTAIGGSNTLVTGAAFSDTAIEQRGDLDQFRVLYFATHGLLPQPGGCLPEPALLTSLGDGDSDGLLDMTKIIGLKLDADLVVLSACDTGGASLGGDADTTGLGSTGEALGGLTRAFIYAGARSLIVSHWKIDSDATVRLMTAMFQAQADSQSGALQLAELKMMDSPDQFSHPYYWAAFTVVGDGGRPMPR